MRVFPHTLYRGSLSISLAPLAALIASPTVYKMALYWLLNRITNEMRSAAVT
jgi:hypothetical protein